MPARTPGSPPAPVVYFTGGGVAPQGPVTQPEVFPELYGAKGDGVSDDWGALVAAYAAVQPGGTLRLTRAYRFTQKLSFNNIVNVLGQGRGSALLPDLNNAGVDAIVVNDTLAANIYGIRYDNFAVLSPTANCCRNGIVFNRVFISEINLHVKCAAAQYGVVVNGCLMTKFRIVTSGNFSYAPLASGLPVVGDLQVLRDAINAISTNQCVFDVYFEAGAAVMRIEDQGGQGNNEVGGTIEGGGTGARAFYAKGSTGLSIRRLHIESNVGSTELDTCTLSEIGGGSIFAPGGAAGKIIITGCDRIEFGALSCDSVDVDATSKRISFGGGFGYGLAGGVVTDNSARARSDVKGGISPDRGDADVVLTTSDAPTQRFATALTANRTITLQTANFRVAGDRFRIVRTGLGAFTLDVGGLKLMPAATAAWCEVEYDGNGNWRLVGYGTL